MLDGFTANNSDMYTNIRSILNKTLLHDYGIIYEVFDDGYVAAYSVQKRGGTLKRLECRYLTPRSKSVSVENKPEVGDLVLILTLQHRDDEIFDLEEPIEVSNPRGYSEMNCVCIPLGSFNDEAETVTKARFNDEGCSVETEGKLLAKAKEDMTLESEEKVIVNGDTVEIRGNSKHFVTYEDLDTALSLFQASVDTAIAGAITGHVHSAVPALGPAAPGVGAAPATSIDISASKTDNVKTGG